MSVTVAPGMTPPCASFTEPNTVAVLTCAAAGRAIAQSSTAIAMVSRLCLTLGMMTSSSAWLSPSHFVASHGDSDWSLAYRSE